MNGILGVTVTAAYCSLRITQGSPIGCREDEQCPSRYYCETSRLFCQECLQCESFRRQPPVGHVTCITSVTQCGSCFAGFTSESERQHCTSMDKILLPYEWAVIAVGLVLAVLICIAIVYILRNLNTFKIRASTSVHTPAENSLIEANAPLPPPPYSAIMTNMELTESSPFIKDVSPSRRDDSCESATRQTARVFNDPVYVGPSQPLSDDTPEILSPIQEEQDEQNSSNTRRSPGNMNSNLEVQVPLAKELHLQDSNNNLGQDSGDRGEAQAFARNATNIFINVINEANKDVAA